MSVIITGSFEEQARAERAMSNLAAAGFPYDQMTTFYVNPPGQHDLFPVGGDRDESPGTESAAGTSASGAVVGGVVGVAVGIATLPLLGPGAAVAGAGAGAYVGSLYGALGGTDDKNNPETPAEHRELARSDQPRTSGVLVGVTASAPALQADAVRILREQGATDIEHTEGTIIAGNWNDFDPLKPLQLVSSEGAANSGQPGTPASDRIADRPDY